MPLTFAPVDVRSDQFITILRYANQFELKYALARFQAAQLKRTSLAQLLRKVLEEADPSCYIGPVAAEGYAFSHAAVCDIMLAAPHDEHEQAALRAILPSTYVVAFPVRHMDTVGPLAHARAHALWEARTDYRDNITAMLEYHYTQLVRDEMRATLLAAGCAPELLIDEIQAHHQWGWDTVLGHVAPMCPEFKLAQDNYITQLYREARSTPAVA